MRRLRPAHIPLVLGAIARSLIGTRAGRRFLAAFGGATALVVYVSGGSEAAKRHEGTWSGMHNEYAPNNGAFTIEGERGKAATCTIRGRAGSANGSGWVFRGDLTVEELACDARIGKDGRVTGRLKLKKEWAGSVKGIGGDWEPRSGSAVCEGDLDGTLSTGTWKGTCPKLDGGRYDSQVDWTIPAE